MSRTFEKFKSFIKRHAMLEESSGVVVAVSGGPDSVTLLDMLARLREMRAALKIHIAHLDHKLRGSESAEDAEFVRQLADRLEFPLTIDSADARVEAESYRRGIEEIAREMRYDFLLRVARQAGCDRIATGHTMSDQAETFLMRLARGAGLRGLAAMRPVGPAHEFAGRVSGAGCQVSAKENIESEISDSSTRHPTPERPARGTRRRRVGPDPTPGTWPLLIRPLLCISREEVEEYCSERKLEFRIDPTNLSADYTRNRVRRDVLPALRSINPRVVESIARAAEIIQTDQDALDRLASKSLDQARMTDQAINKEALIEEKATYGVEALLAEPAGLRRRMIIEAINRARARKANDGSGQITSAHIRSAERLLEDDMSGSRITLPCGLRVWREFDTLVFTYANEPALSPEAFCYERELSTAQPEVKAGGFVLTLERGQPFHLFESLIEQAQREKESSGRDWLFAVMDDRALPERLSVRPRRAGERALVLGRRKTKKLKNLMIDHRIPSSRRRIWPVVTTTDGRYIWSPGLPLAEEFAARDKTQRLAILRASTV